MRYENKNQIVENLKIVSDLRGRQESEKRSCETQVVLAVGEDDQCVAHIPGGRYSVRVVWKREMTSGHSQLRLGYS